MFVFVFGIVFVFVFGVVFVFVFGVVYLQIFFVEFLPRPLQMCSVLRPVKMDVKTNYLWEMFE